jgi:hypothetical protein
MGEKKTGMASTQLLSAAAVARCVHGLLNPAFPAVAKILKDVVERDLKKRAAKEPTEGSPH